MRCVPARWWVGMKAVNEAGRCRCKGVGECEHEWGVRGGVTMTGVAGDVMQRCEARGANRSLGSTGYLILQLAQCMWVANCGSLLRYMCRPTEAWVNQDGTIMHGSNV